MITHSTARNQYHHNNAEVSIVHKDRYVRGCIVRQMELVQGQRQRQLRVDRSVALTSRTVAPAPCCLDLNRDLMNHHTVCFCLLSVRPLYLHPSLPPGGKQCKAHGDMATMAASTSACCGIYPSSATFWLLAPNDALCENLNYIYKLKAKGLRLGLENMNFTDI